MPDADPGCALRKGFLPDAVVPDDFDTMGSEEIADLFDQVQGKGMPADR